MLKWEILHLDKLPMVEIIVQCFSLPSTFECRHKSIAVPYHIEIKPKRKGIKPTKYKEATNPNELVLTSTK
jgi:hypothetical protein